MAAPRTVWGQVSLGIAQVQQGLGVRLPYIAPLVGVLVHRSGDVLVVLGVGVPRLQRPLLPDSAVVPVEGLAAEGLALRVVEVSTHRLLGG